MSYISDMNFIMEYGKISTELNFSSRYGEGIMLLMRTTYKFICTRMHVSFFLYAVYHSRKDIFSRNTASFQMIAPKLPNCFKVQIKFILVLSQSPDCRNTSNSIITVSGTTKVTCAEVTCSHWESSENYTLGVNISNLYSTKFTSERRLV